MSQVPPPPQPPYPQQPYGQSPQGYPPLGQGMGMPPAGAGPGGAYAPAPQKKTSGAAVASLILGILGCVPFVTGLLAIILGIVGIRRTKDPRYSGRGMAIAGIILGLISIVLWGLFGGGAAALYVYGKPAREAANQFARDLSVGNIDSAQARCTATISRDQLVSAAEKVKPWGVLQDTTLPAVAINKSGGVETVEVVGVAMFPNAPQALYSLRMIKQGDEFKIDGFLLQHANGTVTAGTTPNTNAGKGRGAGTQ